MGDKLNIFQVVLLCIFGGITVIAVLVFAVFRSGGESSTARLPVVIWGTLPSGVISGTLSELRKNGQTNLEGVTYVERDPRNFFASLTEAIASGRGPDMVIIEHSAIATQRHKLETLSFEQYPERSFRESFVAAGNIFLTPAGILGIPVAVDPMVLYWNTERFSSAGLALPPVYWQEMYDLVPKLSVIENDFTVTRSTIGFGEYTNVTNAGSILSVLFLQAGVPMVEWQGSRLVPSIDSGGAHAALRFFVEFSNPTRAAYNWNRSLSSSRDMFLSGNLAMYPGFASEQETLREANPNLPFEMALLPQAKTAAKRVTYATVYGFAVPKASKNKGGAWAAAAALTNQAAITLISERLGWGPVRRDVASTPKPGAVDSILSESAIISQAWLEPGRDSLDRIFSRMVENVTTGRENINAAVSSASQELSEVLE